MINLLLELILGVKKMSSTDIEKEIEYNEITNELLDRIDNLRKKTKASMLVGESNILKGIIIVEEAVKAINPFHLDDESISMIQKCVDIMVYKEEEMKGKVNSHIRYGIDMCLMMIEIFCRSKKHALVKKVN